MSRMHGPKECFVPVRQDASQVIISYEKTADGKKNAYWYEVYLWLKKGKPTLEQVKRAVYDDINQQVKAKIVGGYKWNDIPVWLSEENQMNFTQAVVPAMFKIGEQEDGTPIYHTFETKEKMTAFATACTQWRQQCLQEGWQRKDAIDWTPYEEALEKMNA